MSPGRPARVLTLGLALLGSSCAGSSDYFGAEARNAGATSLAAQLSAEAGALMDLLGFGQVVIAAVLVLLGWAATRLVHRGALLAWRLGMDAQRRLAPIRSATNVVIVGAVGYLLLRRFLAAAPVITLLTLALAASVGLIVLSHPLQNVWAGFVLSFRRRVREGDRVSVAGHVGIVRDIGFTQLHLRCADGATTLVPNRLALREPLRVEQAKNTVPVTVRVPTDPLEAGPDLLRLARRTALLSPFRAPGTPAEVDLVEPGLLQVIVQIWSDRGVREARVHLDTQLRAALSAEGAKRVPADP